MDNAIRSKVASLLKFYREQSGLTVYEVGELIGKSGKTVSAWENMRGQPDADTFLKLCDVYKVENVSVFFGQHGKSCESKKMDMRNINLIEKFNSLDERGKQAVEAILQNQYELISAKSTLVQDS